MAPRFGMKTEEDDETIRLALSGEFDLAWVPEVDAELSRIERFDTRRRLVLDLRGLTFMDSSGLRLVITAHARGRRTGRPITVVRGPEHVQHVFEITGMDRELVMVDDPEDPPPAPGGDGL